MQLNETFLAKPIFEEVQREKLPETVLCRVTYPTCNIGKRNANKRVYEKAVWDKVLSEEELKDKLEKRALFGHAEHPEQTQSNLEKVSHVIHRMWIDEKKNELYQTLDIFDTPTGRIVDVILRADCQVGVSTRAEGDLEEAEDDEGTYQRVIPESYRYVTTDFTADPSTFGVVPQDVKRNIISTVGKELSNEKADKSEREFARLLLESMKCGKKDDCQKCGCCKALEELVVKAETKKTVKDLITDSTIKVGTKVKYGDQDAEVKEIKENAVTIVYDDSAGKHVDVQIQGSAMVEVHPEGTVTIAPQIETALVPLPPQKEIDQMDAAGPLPIEDEVPEEEEIEEFKTNEVFTLEFKPGQKVEVKEKTYEVVAVGTKYLIVKDSDGNETVVMKLQVSEPKVDETVRKKKDGWHVYSKKGKHLGGPYKTKPEAEKRLAQVEKFKHVKKDVNEAKFKVTCQHKTTGEKEEIDVFAISKEVARRKAEHDYVTKDWQIVNIQEIEESKSDQLLEEFYTFMDEKNFPDWDEGVKLFAKHKKLDANTLTEQFTELFPEGDIISENWKDLPKGWTKASLKSFAKSLLGKVGKTGKGFVTACMKKMEGAVDNPAAFCAGLKDEVMGTTKWRGKESIKESTASVARSIVDLYKEKQERELDFDNVVDYVSQLKEDDYEALEKALVEGDEDTVAQIMSGMMESKSISTTAKEITDLKVKEASTRAERDKALELLEELTNKGNKSLESKMLVSRIRKILEAKEQEVNALRTKLEEKAKLASELKEKGTKLKEELDGVKINLVTNIRGLEETAKVIEEKHADEIKQLVANYVAEIAQFSEKHDKEIKQLKTEFNTKISEEIEKAKKEVVSDFVKRFVSLRLAESELKVDDNSRALLENCKSLEDVDDTFDEILDASRRGALHSNLIESIEVRKPVDPEQQEAERQVNNVFEGMGYSVKGVKQ